MTIRVAINGYGRIGRNILRAHYEGGKKHDIEIVAINDLGDAETNAHLTRTTPRTASSPARSRSTATAWSSTATASRCCASATRPSCPGASSASTWCSSAPASSRARRRPRAHLKGGAKKVIISAPGGKDVDATVVYGVNHRRAQGRRTR